MNHLRPTIRTWQIIGRVAANAIQPTRITVHDDGSVVAWYGDDPLLRYDSLEVLIARHALGMTDLEIAEDEAPPRSGLSLRPLSLQRDGLRHSTGG